MLCHSKISAYSTWTMDFGLHKDSVNSALPNCRSDEFHQLRLSQMNMHVRRSRQLQPIH